MNHDGREFDLVAASSATLVVAFVYGANPDSTGTATSPQPFRNPLPQTGTRVIIPGIPAGTCVITVVAVNAAGTSAESNPVNVAVP